MNKVAAPKCCHFLYLPRMCTQLSSLHILKEETNRINYSIELDFVVVTSTVSIRSIIACITFSIIFRLMLTTKENQMRKIKIETEKKKVGVSSTNATGNKFSTTITIVRGKYAMLHRIALRKEFFTELKNLDCRGKTQAITAHHMKANSTAIHSRTCPIAMLEFR